MGGTALRALVATASFGTSELARDKPFQPGGGKTNPFGLIPGASTIMAGAKLAGINTPILSGEINKATTAIASTPTAPGMTEDEKTRLANQAASQRRKDYANLGRSSTILTGPGGLGGTGAGQQKTLLGY